MRLLDRYQQAVFDLLLKVRTTQREIIERTGEIIAKAIENGGRVYLSEVCHGIDKDLLLRGGGPAFYRPYEKGKTELKMGDVLFVSSVSGRTESVVNLAYESVKAGVIVVALTSMEYAQVVDAVHPSGKKLYEIATQTIDNCAPAAEAMLDVEGIEARFAAASGLASDVILWSITAVVIEQLLKDGYTPGVYKSANMPGGMDYYHMINERYDKLGY